MQDITLPLRQIHVAAKSVTGIQFQAYLASGLSMSCKTAFKNKKNHTCTLPCASPAQTFLLKPMQNHILVCKLSSSAGLSHRVLSQAHGTPAEMLLLTPSHTTAM